MTPYAQEISEATGQSDPAALALVEDLMRINRTGLDDLSRAEFGHLARRALDDARAMNVLGMLPAYCEALGLAVPTEI